MRAQAFVALVGIAFGSPSLAVEQASFVQLAGPTNATTYPYDISGDGRVIVGMKVSSAARWAADGSVEYPNWGGLPWATNQDGSVAVGSKQCVVWPHIHGAFRASPGSAVCLGVPGAEVDPQVGYEVSGDGSVVVGRAKSPDGQFVPYFWTAETGPRFLMTSSGPLYYGSAEGVSADGSIIVGTAGNEAFRWSRLTGLLERPPAPEADSWAAAVSADGLVTVGTLEVEYGVTEPFRWHTDGSFELLGRWPGHLETMAAAVSGDGRRIMAYSGSRDERRVIVWDEENGFRDLLQVLIEEYGLDLGAWWFEQPTGISDDGRRIIGFGGTTGGPRAWLATLPAACSDGLDNDGDGATDAGADPGCESEDDFGEISKALACDDGIDNDGDGRTDFRSDPALGDPGCGLSSWPREDSQCDDGIDNDGDGGVDSDGGASGVADADCTDRPWRDTEETRRRSCGLGFEVTLALVLVGARRPRAHLSAMPRSPLRIGPS